MVSSSTSRRQRLLECLFVLSFSMTVELSGSTPERGSCRVIEGPSCLLVHPHRTSVTEPLHHQSKLHFLDKAAYVPTNCDGNKEEIRGLRLPTQNTLGLSLLAPSSSADGRVRSLPPFHLYILILLRLRIPPASTPDRGRAVVVVDICTAAG